MPHFSVMNLSYLPYTVIDPLRLNRDFISRSTLKLEWPYIEGLVECYMAMDIDLIDSGYAVPKVLVRIPSKVEQKSISSKIEF